MPSPSEQEPSPGPVDLVPVLEDLVRQVDPDGVGVAAISVRWAEGAASVNGRRPVDSASSAKLYWTAAALAATADPHALEADALAVFTVSENDAAGRLIDVAGGVDAVNAFTAGLGLDGTSLSAWSYGTERQAADRADRGLDNLTTTDDLVAFLAALEGGDVLDEARRALLLRWMRSTPDDLASSSGLDGLLTDGLPGPVAAASAHKAGWLGPGCCVRIEHVVVAAGRVPLPDGSRVLIAVAAQDAPDFDRAVAWVPSAVCRVWVALGGVAECPRPQDPEA